MPKKPRINASPLQAQIKSRLRKKIILMATAGVIGCSLLGVVMTQSFAKAPKVNESHKQSLAEAMEMFEKAVTQPVGKANGVFENPIKVKALESLQKKSCQQVIKMCETVYTESPKTPEAAKARLLTAVAHSYIVGKRDEFCDKQLELAVQENNNAAQNALDTEFAGLLANHNLAVLKKAENLNRFAPVVSQGRVGKEMQQVTDDLKSKSDLWKRQAAFGKAGINVNEVEKTMNDISRITK